MRHQRENDTIAAISTALGESGIGIIRISGTDAVDIASRVLDRGVRKAETHTIHYRHAVCKNEIIDEVLVSVMLAPRSYTGENTVEINCHGGVLAVERVLEEVLKAGASLAEPGEFSKRAFLNGRIDLSQAEAVMDIIQAKNRFALKAAVSQLSGTLSKKLKELRNQLLDETAWIEAALDDPEHYDLSGYPEELGKKNRCNDCRSGNSDPKCRKWKSHEGGYFYRYTWKTKCREIFSYESLIRRRQGDRDRYRRNDARYSDRAHPPCGIVLKSHRYGGNTGE